MPDGMREPKLLGQMAKRTPRQMAIDTAKDLERACGWREIPIRPFSIQHLTRKAVAELRSDREEASKTLLAEWTTWTVTYSSAVTENISRLRGLLWCWRQLRECVASNPRDREAADFLGLVRAFLRDEWRLPNPPTDRVACNDIARRLVESRADVRTGEDPP